MRLAALFAAVLLATPVSAETLGWGRLITNDVFGDTRDRWRTGSYRLSNIQGDQWTGRRPGAPGEIIELRFHGELIAPRSIVNPRPVDRRMAGTLSFGAHTHFNRGGLDYSLGGDLIFVGPQTGLDGFQKDLHELLGQPLPTDAVRANQIGNTTRLGFTAEIARPMRPNEVTLIRPFAEVVTAPETLARVGIDVMIGVPGQNDLLLREASTGHLYRGTDTAFGGHSFVLGADLTQVVDSLYLPDGDPATRSDFRYRIRGGWHWQFGEDTSFFYGVTYLSEEFEEQGEGQIVGSLKLNFNF